MPDALKSMITGLASGIELTDGLGREHRQDTLLWLAGTDDIFRRVKPRTPDVSLWFTLAGRVGQPLQPDQREFAQFRWWTVAELHRAGLDPFGPHLLRALAALGLDRRSL